MDGGGRGHLLSNLLRIWRGRVFAFTQSLSSVVNWHMHFS